MNVDYLSKLKIIVERHEDCYTAYPLGVEGACIGQGKTFDEALADVRSAIRAHVKVFGIEALNLDQPVLEARIVDDAVETERERLMREAGLLTARIEALNAAEAPATAPTRRSRRWRASR